MPDYISRAEVLRHKRQVTGCVPDEERLTLAVYATDIRRLPNIDPTDHSVNDIIDRQELLSLQKTAMVYGAGNSVLTPVVYEKDILEIPSAAPGDTLRWIERPCVKEFYGRDLPAFECPSCGFRFCDILNDYSRVYQVCPHCRTPLDGSLKATEFSSLHSVSTH